MEDSDMPVASVQMENGINPQQGQPAFQWGYPPAHIIPAQVEKHLDFIDIVETNLILGASNLSSRYWAGGVWYFNNPDDAPDVCKCVTGVECEGSVTAGRFLSNKEVIVTQDSGTVCVMELQETPQQETFHFSTVASSLEHDSSVLVLDLLKDRTRAVTGSMDGCLKVWDIKSLVGECTYRPAHKSAVISVSSHIDEHSMFMSCSQDGEVILWDIRQPKPAKYVAVANMQNIPSCVTLHPVNNHLAAVGYQTGNVAICDYRQDVDCCQQVGVHSRPVYQLVFAPSSPHYLASCADDTYVVVTDFSEDSPLVVYKDDRHSDFVRGICWQPQTKHLYSCGWDKQVLKHQIHPMETNGE